MNKSALFDKTSAAFLRGKTKSVSKAERGHNVWREQYHDNEGHRADKAPDEIVVHPQPTPAHTNTHQKQVFNNFLIA